MFFFTARLNRKKLAGAVTACGLLLCAFIILISNRGAEIPALGSAAGPANAKTNENRIDFLASFGWEVNPEAIEKEEVRIPELFSDTYKNYNDLQKAQGFDLEEYRGKTVTRYCYEVINYPSGEMGVRANILVYKDEIIAGDVSSVRLDGFMHGLKMPE